MRITTTSAALLCGALLCLFVGTDALKCDFFKITTGYLEASGGGAGNIACKKWPSLAAAKAECLGNRQCDGFSFSKNAPYGGCLKKNRAANYNPNKGYDGYHKTLMGCTCDRDYEPVSPICGPRELAVVSVGKKATQSTLAWGGLPKRAVDTNKNPNYFSNGCTHTKQQESPWWRVDLGAVYDIEKISILNRKDCCTARLNGAEVRVGNSPAFMDNAVCQKGLKFGPGENKSIGCKMKGRYVSVRIPGPKKILTLCDVSVFAWVPKATLAPAQLFGMTPLEAAIEYDQPLTEMFEQFPDFDKSPRDETELMEEAERAGMPPPEGYFAPGVPPPGENLIPGMPPPEEYFAPGVPPPGVPPPGENLIPGMPPPEGYFAPGVPPPGVPPPQGYFAPGVPPPGVPPPGVPPPGVPPPGVPPPGVPPPQGSFAPGVPPPGENLIPGMPPPEEYFAPGVPPPGVPPPQGYFAPGVAPPGVPPPQGSFAPGVPPPEEFF